MFWLFARQQTEAKAETAPKGERNPNPNPTEWNKSLSPNRRRKVVISCCVLVLCWQYSVWSVSFRSRTTVKLSLVWMLCRVCGRYVLWNIQLWNHCARRLYIYPLLFSFFLSLSLFLFWLCRLNVISVGVIPHFLEFFSLQPSSNFTVLVFTHFTDFFFQPSLDFSVLVFIWMV